MVTVLDGPFVSNTLFQDTVTFESIDEMTTNNKGRFGESLAGVWLMEKIRQTPQLITDVSIPEEAPKLWFSSINGSAAVDRVRYYLSSEKKVTGISWEPDFRFDVTLPRYDVDKRVLIESKVGDSSPAREQLRVMKLTADPIEADSMGKAGESRSPERVVFLCNISLSERQLTIECNKILPEAESNSPRE